MSVHILFPSVNQGAVSLQIQCRYYLAVPSLRSNYSRGYSCDSGFSEVLYVPRSSHIR